MGIPFKLYEGKEANLPAELTAGGIYFCEDSGNVFIDVDIDGTVTRVPLGKKYVDDQLVDIREFIENQGSGIEIGDEAPTKESANVWINTSDEDEEGVEYLGVVTSINGQGGDVNISASDIDAAEKTHASQHAANGSDPITPAAIGALNKAGDTMTGDLTIEKGNPKIVFKNATKGNCGFFEAGTNRVLLASTTDDTNSVGRFLSFHNNNNASLRQAIQLTERTSSGDKDYDILHTGNKPSGSYTGNGDATMRTIEMGGFGYAVLVWNASGGFALVSNGAITQYGSTITGLWGDEGYYKNGIMTIATTNSLLNASGVTYYYQVL